MTYQKIIKVLGHSDIATTMDIYNHADYERIQNEMTLIYRLFEP